MVQFNADHKTDLDEMLLDLPGVRTGKLFGDPAYYAGGRSQGKPVSAIRTAENETMAQDKLGGLKKPASSPAHS